MKKTLAIALATVSLFSFSACSKKSSSAAASSVTVGSRTATLRFSWWGGDARAKATLDVIKQFEEKYPKITIQGEYGSSDGYNDKLATELSAGTAPDIMQVDTGYFPTYINTNKNYFIDFKKYKIDLSGFDADFLKSNGYFDGHQLGLPTGITGYSLIINKGLADQIGVDFSKQYTWDDLSSYAAKLKAVNKDDYLIASNLSSAYDNILRPYIRQLTGNALLIDSTKKLGVTQDQLTQALTMIKTLYDSGVIPPENHMSAYENDNIQKDPNWIAGKYVGAYCVASTIDVLAAANKNANYIAGKMPTLQDGKSDGYFTDCPQYMSVSAKSQHIPESVAFLDYFFNNKDAAKILGVQRSVPPVKSSQEVCEQNNLVDALTKGAVDVSLSYNGKSDSGFSTSNEVKSIMQDTISQVAYGKKSPSQAAQSAITLLNNYLANQK